MTYVPAPVMIVVDPAHAQARLAEVLARAGLDEARPSQSEFAAEAAPGIEGPTA